MARIFRPPLREVVHYEHARDGQNVVFDGHEYRLQAVGMPVLAAFDASEYVVVSRLKEHAAQNGEYPWDQWRTWAVADGVGEELADLGRAVIREADQHGWSEELQAECGWLDHGQAMIEQALRKPEEAHQRWQTLLDTDGERGRSNAHGEWEPR